MPPRRVWVVAVIVIGLGAVGAMLGARQYLAKRLLPDEGPIPRTLARQRRGAPSKLERHLANIRQLTHGGENAEAYWSPDGRRLILQITRDRNGCDQEYVMDVATGEARRISSGLGRTTCGYFGWPTADFVFYSSTFARGAACPPPPDRSHGYVWALYDYDIYRARPDGSEIVPLVTSPGYDAEGTMAFDGSRIVFTSTRDGDLELYSMAPDGSDVRRLTTMPGYDGGAFYSPDSRRLVWRASRPEGEALAEYRALLDQKLVRPTALEIWVANADGTNARQVTHNGAANFGPYFLPDSRRVIWASNAGGSPREFDLWMVDPEADAPPERVTFADGFDGFPMFSPDGRYLAWSSNRAGAHEGDTNVFVAQWVE